MKHLETYLRNHDGTKALFASLDDWISKSRACFWFMAWEAAAGRYLQFGEKLTEMGVSVFTFDGRGHGNLLWKTRNAYFDSYPKITSKTLNALFEGEK